MIELNEKGKLKVSYLSIGKPLDQSIIKGYDSKKVQKDINKIFKQLENNYFYHVAYQEFLKYSIEENLELVIVEDPNFNVKSYSNDIPLTNDTTFEGQWIFSRGNKRGIWFNVFSRSYFWVEFTIDEKNVSDKYELTKFAFEKIERIRHLTFDSKYRSVVFNTLRAEKTLYDKYANNNEYKETFKLCESGQAGLNVNIYTYIRKALSFYGSARILDFMDDNDLYNIVYEKLEKALLEVHKGNIDYLNI